MLIGEGLIGAVETSAVTLGEAGAAPRFSEGVRAGAFRLMDATCPAMLAGLVAGQKGVPFMPIRGIIGSDLMKVRPDWKIIDNPFATDDPIVVVPGDPARRRAVPCARSRPLRQCPDRPSARTRQHGLCREATLVTVERIRDTSLLADEVRRRRCCRRSMSRQSRRPGAAPGRWGYGANIQPTTPRSRAMPAWRNRPKASPPIWTGLRGTSRRWRERWPCDARELLIVTIADLLNGVRQVAVGASSPIPAAGAMLLRARNEARGLERVRIVVLGSREHNFFTNGGVELFDCAAQGRVDAFFLGGGQIDGQGNINLVGTGEYPKSDVRWPGSFGSAYLYYVVPRVILFREEHSPRVFVKEGRSLSARPASAKASCATADPTRC